MNLSVIKFGGTSLGNLKLMNNAAEKLIAELALADRVIVVVSAIAGVTDHLVTEANSISDLNNDDKLAEYANIITTGEQAAAGLFTLILQNKGIKARSWLGWQTGILTNSDYEDASIEVINPGKIVESLKTDYQVAVVTGFQGISSDGRITTLGRGGSDTTAIALAGTLGCKSCKIYTDVEGVYTADPRIVAKAQKIDELNFDEMILLASCGAKVLQTKSAELAKKFQTKIEVLSSFNDKPGTIISDIKSYHSILGISLGSRLANSMFAKVSIVGRNIDKNSDLIKIISEKFNEDILNINTKPSIIELDVKEENKFNITKDLHTICNLE